MEDVLVSYIGTALKGTLKPDSMVEFRVINYTVNLDKLLMWQTI
jgi:hypothetical protein